MKEVNLGRWLTGALSHNELQSLGSTTELGLYTKIADTSATLEAPAFDTMVSFESFKAAHMKKETKVIQMSATRLIFKAAAVAVVLLASYLYLDNIGIGQYTGAGEIAEVVLPDNSNVKLNANSQLTFKKGNWDNSRAVNLKGEAFFKVAKGQKFDVNTEDGVVSVLGTQFNVESRDGFFEVSCYEGLVNVNYNNKDIKLPAGNAIQLINGVLVKSEVRVNDTPSWTKGESDFNSMPLGLVINELERVYKIKVINDSVDLGQKYSGVFEHDNLHGALQSICIPLNIDFEIDKNSEVIFSEKTE